MPFQNALQAASFKTTTATLSRWTLSEPCTFERTRIFTSPRPIQLSRPAGKMGYLERSELSTVFPTKMIYIYQVSWTLFSQDGLMLDAIEILNKQKNLGQYPALFSIWPVPWVGRMNRDWLPERERWSYLAPLGTARCVPQEKFSWEPYSKSFIDQVCSVKIAGYKPMQKRERTVVFLEKLRYSNERSTKFESLHRK